MDLEFWIVVYLWFMLYAFLYVFLFYDDVIELLKFMFFQKGSRNFCVVVVVVVVYVVSNSNEFACIYFSLKL